MTKQDIKKSVVDKIIDFTSSAFSNAFERNDLERKSADLAADILDAVQTSADESAKKSYGDCDECAGKGFKSFFQVGDGVTDPGVITDQKVVHQLCHCARGRSLKLVIMSNPIWTDPYEQKES